MRAVFAEGERSCLEPRAEPELLKERDGPASKTAPVGPTQILRQFLTTCSLKSAVSCVMIAPW